MHSMVIDPLNIIQLFQWGHNNGVQVSHKKFMIIIIYIYIYIFFYNLSSLLSSNSISFYFIYQSLFVSDLPFGSNSSNTETPRWIVQAKDTNAVNHTHTHTITQPKSWEGYPSCNKQAIISFQASSVSFIQASDHAR